MERNYLASHSQTSTVTSVKFGSGYRRVNIYVVWIRNYIPLFTTGDPPHNRADLHTTEHCAAHNRASCWQNGGTWTRRFGTKTSGFRAFKCVPGTIVVKALFSVMERHTLGKTNNYSEYSKVKNAICKHARLSKQIGPVVCNASSVVCRAMFWAHSCSVVCRAMFWAHSCSVVCSVGDHQEHNITLNDSTEFIFNNWS